MLRSRLCPLVIPDMIAEARLEIKNTDISLYEKPYHPSPNGKIVKDQLMGCLLVPDNLNTIYMY
jgi:hypothetical protein